MTNHVQNDKRQVAVFLLTVLQSVLNEQQKARIIEKQTADYIYLAVKDQAIRQGYLE
jgi:hypothetical protein